MQSTITRYYSSAEHTDAVSLMWNQLMTEMHCCGVEDYTDFDKSEMWRVHKGENVVPANCCHHQNAGIDGMLKLVDDSCPKYPSESNSNFKQVWNCNYYFFYLNKFTLFFSGMLRKIDPLDNAKSKHYHFRYGWHRFR